MAPAYGKMMGSAVGGDLRNYYAVVEHNNTATLFFRHSL
jgi:hypothetical protein